MLLLYAYRIACIKAIASMNSTLSCPWDIQPATPLEIVLCKDHTITPIATFEFQKAPLKKKNCRMILKQDTTRMRDISLKKEN